jgi:Protein of unknown function (DUF664)
MAEVMVDEQGRPEPPCEGGEVATLPGFLDHQRATLEWKCRGLSDEHADWQLQHPLSLRWVLVHMIEEYARHNGHADLMRESIDGQTGD